MKHASVGLVVLLAASVAHAQDGRHTHDGFYVRIQTGAGYTRTSLLGQDFAFRGISGAFNLEVGGAVATDFIVYGKVFSTYTSRPTVDMDGETFTGELAGVQGAALNTLGVGATWYLMPGNLYLTGALSMADIAIALDSQQGGSNVGVGLHLGLGKEWWVSDNWALGVGAELALSRLPGRSGSASTWGVASLSTLFSMTYN